MSPKEQAMTYILPQPTAARVRIEVNGLAAGIRPWRQQWRAACNVSISSLYLNPESGLRANAYLSACCTAKRLVKGCWMVMYAGAWWQLLILILSTVACNLLPQTGLLAGQLAKLHRSRQGGGLRGEGGCGTLLVLLILGAHFLEGVDIIYALQPAPYHEWINNDRGVWNTMGRGNRQCWRYSFMFTGQMHTSTCMLSARQHSLHNLSVMTSLELAEMLCQGKSCDWRILSFWIYKSSRQSNKMFTNCICGSIARCRTVLWEVTFVCVALLCAPAKSWCSLFWWSPSALAHLYAAISDQQTALYHKQPCMPSKWRSIEAICSQSTA